MFEIVTPLQERKKRKEKEKSKEKRKEKKKKFVHWARSFGLGWPMVFFYWPIF